MSSERFVSVNDVWGRLPNEEKLSGVRAAGQPEPVYHQHPEFNPSPRSSISSSFSTPPGSASPAHTSLPLPPLNQFRDSGAASSKISGLYQEPTSALFSGLSFLSGRERDFGLNAFGTTLPASSVAAGPLVTSSPKLPTTVLSPPESDQPPSQHTQTALAEIFAGNPRPHYRSASFSATQSTPPIHSPRLDHLPPATTSPRSYFAPPLPSAPLLVRARSQSSAPAPMSYGGPRPPTHQPTADQYGFRPSNNTPFASSLPSSTTSQSIRIGSAVVPSSPIPDDGFSPSQSRFGGQFGSFNGGSPSLGGGMYDPQTGWRSTNGGRPGSFGAAEDAEREGRSRMRSEEQYRPWGDSEGGGSGIGASNMSPFSRDGGRTLPDLVPDGGGYRARREYSLGAVGSGRKRGDTLWSSRPLREAEDEDAEDAYAPPTKSGATSRRHSVSGFNPPNRSQFGFSFPDEMRMSKNDTNGNGGGFSSLSPNGGGGSYGAFGRGSSAIDDDDLASDFNSLQLNLEAHAAATEGSQRVFHVGSMPTNFPPSRSTSHYGESSPEIPMRDLFGSSSSSRFVQASPAIGSRSASRFEFGGTGTGSPSQSQGEFTSAGGYPSQHPPTSNTTIPRYPFAATTSPAPFYTTPLAPQGLSAQAPAFQAFGGPPNPSSQYSHYQQKPSFAPAPPATEQHQSLGRGIPLHTVPTDAPLYIVEFKAGRKDLFFVEDPKLQLRQGDLVIVEADRGQDIGKFFKPCSLDEVQAFQQRLVELALGQLANPGGGAPPNPASIARMTKEFAPKKIFGKAQPADTQMLLSKAQDEVKALALVRSKVAAKNLPMEVCDAEWQWDRKKLTLYYVADTRVDFRELVRELFRLYKTRIWMCCLDQQASSWDFK